jgi:hypothetical protein
LETANWVWTKVASGLVVGLALVVAGAVVGPAKQLPQGGTGSDATVSILATLIGFLGVAVLAVAVSTSLVQVALDRYGDSRLAQPLILDRHRDGLLLGILVGFVVATGNLVLFSLGQLDRLAALVLPVAFSLGTVSSLVAYVLDRMALFDPATYARRLLSGLSKGSRPPLGASFGRRMPARRIADLEESIERVGQLASRSVVDGRRAEALEICRELVAAATATVDSRVRTLAQMSALVEPRGRARVEGERYTPEQHQRHADAEARRAALWLERSTAVSLFLVRKTAAACADREFAADWYRLVSAMTTALARAAEMDSIVAFLAAAKASYWPAHEALLPGEWALASKWLNALGAECECDGAVPRRVAGQLADYLDRLLMDAQGTAQSAQPDVRLRSIESWLALGARQLATKIDLSLGQGMVARTELLAAEVRRIRLERGIADSVPLGPESPSA